LGRKSLRGKELKFLKFGEGFEEIASETRGARRRGGRGDDGQEEVLDWNWWDFALLVLPYFLCNGLNRPALPCFVKEFQYAAAEVLVGRLTGI
jgi:hypothetical protein